MIKQIKPYTTILIGSISTYIKGLHLRRKAGRAWPGRALASYRPTSHSPARCWGLWMVVADFIESRANSLKCQLKILTLLLQILEATESVDSEVICCGLATRTTSEKLWFHLLDFVTMSRQESRKSRKRTKSIKSESVAKDPGRVFPSLRKLQVRNRHGDNLQL